MNQLPHEKFVNVQTMLANLCRKQEKDGKGNCGFIFLLVESGPDNTIRLRSSTGLPISLAIQVLEMTLLDIRTKNMTPDYTVEAKIENVDTDAPLDDFKDLPSEKQQ
jgi:hypothetical protein